MLTYDGIATALGARGVAVLAALVSRAGEYVDKSVIVDAAWPGLVVDEAKLAVQISAIRRVLASVPEGKHRIETLTRRAYRLVGPVARRQSNSERPLLLHIPTTSRRGFRASWGARARPRRSSACSR